MDRPDGRSLALIAPTVAAGVAAVCLAAWTLAATGYPPERLLGLAVLVLTGMLCEAFPVRVGRGGGNLSLGAVVVVATAVMYGPAEAALVGGIARAVDDAARRRPPIRLAYNGAVYAIGGLLAGTAAAFVPGVAGQAFVATLVFYVTLVALVSAVVALTSRSPLRRLLGDAVRDTAPSFAIMASVAFILVVLWRDSPLYGAALLGPLIATALHQRSTQGQIEAMRLALTDAVTGLGNVRAFHERLQAELDRAGPGGAPLSLCLLDLDDFKLVNDTYGHAAGDNVLVSVGACLRGDGEAFRLGGDEFALVLANVDAGPAAETATAVLRRLAELRCDPGGHVTFSAGLATYPRDALDLAGLHRVADDALYVAKRRGKNQLEVASPVAA